MDVSHRGTKQKPFAEGSSTKGEDMKKEDITNGGNRTKTRDRKEKDRRSVRERRTRMQITGLDASDGSDYSKREAERDIRREMK